MELREFKHHLSEKIICPNTLNKKGRSQGNLSQNLGWMSIQIIFTFLLFYHKRCCDALPQVKGCGSLGGLL